MFRFHISGNLIRLLLILIALSLMGHISIIYFMEEDEKPPRKTVRDYQMAMCNFESNENSYEDDDPPSSNCPSTGIVSSFFVSNFNYMICAYTTVLIMSKKTDMEPFLPRCMHTYLSQVFIDLSVPSLSRISNCEMPLRDAAEDLDSWTGPNQSIVLQSFDCSSLDLPYIPDIAKELRFQEDLINNCKDILQIFWNHDSPVHVGIYVPRGWTMLGDEFQYPDQDFYVRTMNTIRKREGNKVVFVVVSGCPTQWKCFQGEDVIFIYSMGLPIGTELGLLSVCNISIVGFEGLGVWGALLTGNTVFAYSTEDGKFESYIQSLEHWHPVY